MKAGAVCLHLIALWGRVGDKLCLTFARELQNVFLSVRLCVYGGYFSLIIEILLSDVLKHEQVQPL